MLIFETAFPIVRQKDTRLLLFFLPKNSIPDDVKNIFEDVTNINDSVANIFDNVENKLIRHFFTKRIATNFYFIIGEKQLPSRINCHSESLYGDFILNKAG